MTAQPWIELWRHSGPVLDCKYAGGLYLYLYIFFFYIIFYFNM